jgi:magnesium-transporting ATPase (P-type)
LFSFSLGSEISALDDDELSEYIEEHHPRVFARVLPEQKLRLVEAFKKQVLILFCFVF